jgi:hypothetical protein
MYITEMTRINLAQLFDLQNRTLGPYLMTTDWILSPVMIAPPPPNVLQWQQLACCNGVADAHACAYLQHLRSNLPGSARESNGRWHERLGSLMRGVPQRRLTQPDSRQRKTSSPRFKTSQEELQGRQSCCLSHPASC